MAITSKETGAAVVEFAFLLPVLVLMVFGITEYGRAMYQYDTLAKSARAAVRHLSSHNSGDTVAKNEARCLAVTGDERLTSDGLSCRASTVLVNGLTVDMVKVCDALDISHCPGLPHANVSTGSGVANLVTVRIEGFRFASVIDFVLPDQTPMGPISATMRQDL